MKRKSILLYICLLLLLLQSEGYAYTLEGGSWCPTCTTVNLKVYQDSSVSSYGYGLHTNYGYSQWNGVEPRFSYSSTTSGSSANVKVFAGDTHDTSWADTMNYSVTSGTTSCWTCTYQYSRIRINDPQAKLETEFQIKKVMTHEFGHALGLDHSSASTAIMRQGYLSYNTLQTDDTAGLKALYHVN